MYISNMNNPLRVFDQTKKQIIVVSQTAPSCNSLFCKLETLMFQT